MTAQTLVSVINNLLQMAFELWRVARQIAGDERIPGWEEILEKNLKLERKIDNERGR